MTNWAWICNECGAQEFTSALCKTDLDYLACSGCGSNEFHKEALAQTQEPVVCRQQYDTCLHPCTPRGENLARRTWQGLTNDEIKDYLLKPVERDLLSFTRFIEAKLKQKNGYAEEKNT